MIVMTSSVGFGGGGSSLIGNANSGNASQSQLSPSSNVRASVAQQVNSSGFNQSLNLSGLQLKQRGNTPINSQSGFPASSISSLAVGSGNSGSGGGSSSGNNNNNNNNGLSSAGAGLSRGTAMSASSGGGSGNSASVSAIFSNLQSSLSSAFSQPPSGSSFLKDDRENSSENGILHTLDPSEFPSLGGRGRGFGNSLGVVGSGMPSSATSVSTTPSSTSSAAAAAAAAGPSSLGGSSFGGNVGGSIGGGPIGSGSSGGSANVGLIGSGGVIGSGASSNNNNNNNNNASNSTASSLPSSLSQNHQTQNLSYRQSSMTSPSGGLLGSGVGGGSLGLESLAPGAGSGNMSSSSSSSFLNGPQSVTPAALLNNSNNLPNPLGRPYAGMMKQAHQEAQPEFQIQPDEFPALPGANKQSGESRSEDGSQKLSSSGTTTGGNVADVSGNLGLIPSSGGVTANGGFRGQPGGLNPAGARSGRGIQTHADGKVTNIPGGMVMDQFGMVGLLTFIRTAEQDPQLAQLAMGSDLTTLGLNLNSPENLYQNFASPWADTQCRPQDIDYHVPQEYLTNTMIRDKLAPIKLSRYGDDLLFFLFYVFPGDVLQIAAAAELWSRDWRYHKEERIWITRAKGQEPSVKTQTYERGHYDYFDCQNWRKSQKEFHLDYDKLEDKPALPNSFYSTHGQ